MTMTSLIVAGLLLVGSASAGSALYAGSGNCDGADPTCVSGPWQLWTFFGQAEEPAEKLSMSGLPSWTFPSTNGECLFVTVTDSHYVLSYAVGAKGKLSLKSNATLAPAMNPVFINQLGDYIIVANYHGPDGGTTDDGTAGISSLKVSGDCSLTMAQFLPEKGRSVDPGRQGMSHIHSVNALPKSKTQFVVCDLGADALISMKMDPTTGMMSETSRLATTVGSGPRHMAFHPTLPIAYTLFEMGSFVGAYSIAADGGLTEAQRVTTLPGRKVYSGYTKAAEIVMTADGKQLLVSNRGYGPDSGSITVYTVSSTTGMLSAGVSTKVGDNFPRGMGVVPGVNPPQLMVAGQSTSKLMTYVIMPNGALVATGLNVTAPPNPTTVSFVAL